MRGSRPAGKGFLKALEKSRARTVKVPQPAPSVEAKMPEGWLRDQGWAVDGSGDDLWFHSIDSKARGMHLRWLRALLATQGLAIVPTADVVTPDERAVLSDAKPGRLTTNAGVRAATAELKLKKLWADIPDELIGIWARYTDEHVGPDLRTDIDAELARRAAKGAKT